jgi:hypothetical protein
VIDHAHPAASDDALDPEVAKDRACGQQAHGVLPVLVTLSSGGPDASLAQSPVQRSKVN